jgi:hypothetical protein
VALSRCRFGPATNMSLPYEHFSFGREVLELVVLSLQWMRHRIVCRGAWLPVGASL